MLWERDVEAFNASLDHKLWSGSNVRLAHEVLMQPKSQETITVNLSRKHFPPNVPFRLLRAVWPSTRSRLAQLHIEPLMATKQITKKDWEAIQAGETRNVKVPTFLLSGRPVHLEKNTQLLRYFYFLAAKPLENDELRKALNDGLIKIDLSSREIALALDAKMERVGIRVPIFNHRWIPAGREVIEIDEKSADYRSKINKLMQPVPRVRKGHIAWIADTPKMTLDASIHAVLSTSLGDLKGNIPTHAYQMTSHLIDPGSDWHIVVEGYSPVSQKKLARDAVFTFWKS